jgi:hypothetical protein
MVNLSIARLFDLATQQRNAKGISKNYFNCSDAEVQKSKSALDTF